MEEGKPKVAQDAAAPNKIRVSERQAAALLTILLERGYFHPHSKKIHHYGEPTLEKPDPQDALLFPVIINNNNEDGGASSYITLDHLTAQFRSGLQQRGRWRLDAAAAELGVSTAILQNRVVPRVLLVESASQQQQQYRVVVAGGSSAGVQQHDAVEVWTKQHLRERLDDLWTTQLRAGCLPVAEAARRLDLPPDFALEVLEEYIADAEDALSSNVQIRLDDHAGKVLVHQAYLDRLQSYLKKVLLEAEEPVHIPTIARERGWELCWVRHVLAKTKDFDLLPGQWQGDDTYVPDQYTQRLKQSVQGMFLANGFVTAHTCQSLLGIAPHQMKEYVLQLDNDDDSSSSSLLVLEHCVLHRVAVVAPLVAALQEVIETQQQSSNNDGGWLDLQLHLPSELLDYHTEDARQLVEEHVLVDEQLCLSSSHGGTVGLACVRANALYFSAAP